MFWNKRVTHDFTEPHWGHNYNVIRDAGKSKLSIVGWCQEEVKRGHFFLLKTTKTTVLFKVMKINNFRDPEDMFSATIKFKGIVKE